MSAESSVLKRDVIVSDHANDRGRVIVQVHENILFAIGPRRRKVFQRDGIERAVCHGSVGRVDDRTTADAINIVAHADKHLVGRRHAGQPIMHASGLLE